MPELLVDLHLHPNEASDLTPVPAALVPDGFDQAYVTVLDEAAADEGVAVLLHARDARPDGGWEARRLHLDAGREAGKTEDAEACAFHDGDLWLAGSHFGSKTGPLQAKRAWFATVDGGDVRRAIDGETVPVRVGRNRFKLHRALNDALLELPFDTRPLGPKAKAALVDATIKKGDKEQKKWAGLVRDGDLPLNIEGMTSLPDGRVLLGLRHPVTYDGRPIVAAIEDPLGEPRFADAWVLDGPTDQEHPLGVRGLTTCDGVLHAIVGSLDAMGKDSVLVEDHAVAGAAHCEHWSCPVPSGPSGHVTVDVVRTFPDEKSVEGVSVGPAGDVLYVVDEDHRVRLRICS